jgi:hypothetical protein
MKLCCVASTYTIFIQTLDNVWMQHHWTLDCSYDLNPPTNHPEGGNPDPDPEMKSSQVCFVLFLLQVPKAADSGIPDPSGQRVPALSH